MGESRVLVVGATGQLGGVIARKLIASGTKVRAIDGQWMNTTTATERALDRVTRGHRPFPAKRLNTAPTEAAETIGTSLPPEIVTPGDDGPPSGSGGVPAWLIVLAAGGGLALVGGGAAAVRRPGGNDRPVATRAHRPGSPGNRDEDSGPGRGPCVFPAPRAACEQHFAK